MDGPTPRNLWPAQAGMDGLLNEREEMKLGVGRDGLDLQGINTRGRGG